MDSNQSGAVGGIILGVFQGSLTHLGASRRLRGQKYIKARPLLKISIEFYLVHVIISALKLFPGHHFHGGKGHIATKDKILKIIFLGVHSFPNMIIQKNQ